MVRRKNVDAYIAVRRQVNQQIKNCIELFLHCGRGLFIFAFKHFYGGRGKFICLALQVFEKCGRKIQKFRYHLTKMVVAIACKQDIS